MCGRFPSTKPAALIGAIEDRAGAAATAVLATAPRLPAGLTSWWAPRANVAPTQPARTIALVDGALTATLARWGLTPPPRGPARGPIINARSETAAGSPLFRGPLARARVLVLADGFYEWRGKAAQRIAPGDDGAVTFAGLLRPWRHGEHVVPEVAILTAAAGPLVAPIHDRQPVVIAADARARWLDPDLPLDAVADLLAPDPLVDWTVAAAPAWINDARTEAGAAPLTLGL
jgi:putative SOS response-associated peptidase YedK